MNKPAALALIVSCAASPAWAQVQVACDPGWTMIHTYKQGTGSDFSAYELDVCVDHMKEPRPVEISCSLDGHKWQSINGSCEAGLEAQTK
jgi:hypothetical protein